MTGGPTEATGKPWRPRKTRTAPLPRLQSRRTGPAGNTETMARHGWGSPSRATTCPPTVNVPSALIIPVGAARAASRRVETRTTAAAGEWHAVGCWAKPSPGVSQHPAHHHPIPPTTHRAVSVHTARSAGDAPAAPSANGPRGKPPHRRSSGRRRRSSSIPPTASQAFGCGCCCVDGSSCGPRQESAKPPLVPRCTCAVPVSATGSDGPFGSPATHHRLAEVGLASIRPHVAYDHGYGPRRTNCRTCASQAPAVEKLPQVRGLACGLAKRDSFSGATWSSGRRRERGRKASGGRVRTASGGRC